MDGLDEEIEVTKRGLVPKDIFRIDELEGYVKHGYSKTEVEERKHEKEMQIKEHERQLQVLLKAISSLRKTACYGDSNCEIDFQFP